MEFKKYQHLERFGTTEVERIELGTAYVFPKIDGSNASLWMSDGNLQAGSRRRHLTLESDNAGFYEWACGQERFLQFFKKYPNVRLYGEWLVPHSLKTYRETAWRNFYVFDVAVDRYPEDITHESDDTIKYMHYEEYKPMLEGFDIYYVPPICTVINGSYEQFVNQLIKNVFLIEDGKGCGEGIVIKNYEWRNKYNRQTWAKIVTSEFKEKHAKAMGGHVVKGKRLIEEEIAEKYVTTALCKKVHAKIENDSGWSSRFIPILLNTVYYDIVKEECWNFVKEHKNPNLNFKTLQHFVYCKVKERVPQYF